MRSAGPCVGLCIGLLLAACSGRLSGGHGGDASGGPVDGPPPPADESVLAGPGLRSVVAGGDAFRITFSHAGLGAPGADGEPAPRLALLGAVTPAGLATATPLELDAEDDDLLVPHLPEGLTGWFVLALSLDDGATWTEVGPTLHATTRAPIYVDPDADPEIADGLSPATAFAEPLPALLTSFLAGGGNVWLRGGDYGPQALPVFAGVALSGGFAPGFDLAARDPVVHATVLHGAAGLPVVDVQGGAAGAVVDGLVLEGDGLASDGLRATDTPVTLCGLVARGASGPGVRLIAPESGDPLAARFVACRLTGHGAEGVSARGGLDLALDACALLDNGQEGLDLDDLVAPSGRTARLVARHCLFAGNATEGLDADLSAPIAGGVEPGDFEVLLQDCLASGNLQSGLRLDLEHEGAPGWRAALLVRGCTSRGNGGDGVALDLDADASALLHRLVASANAGDGVRVTSELVPTLLVISASALHGNGGAGVRGEPGAARLALSHVALDGNAGGGLVPAGPGQASATSCAAWRQPSPWGGALAHEVAAGDDAFAPLFSRAPRDAGLIDGLTAPPDAALLPAAGAPALGPGDLVELGDDGVVRTVVATAGAAVSVSPAPLGLPPSGRFARFSPADAYGEGVREDWHARPGGAADDAGMAPPAAPPVDAGPHGSALLPDAESPGSESRLPAALFRVASVEPAVGTVLAASQPIVVRMAGGEPSPLGVGPASVRVLAGGVPLAAAPLVQDGHVVIQAPAVGWDVAAAGLPLVLELHASLASTDGVPLATPLALPFDAGP